MVGPKIYDIEEANVLIPTFEAAFEELDGIREELKVAKIKLNALEMIWGQALNSDENPDHKEGVSLLEEMKSLEEKFSAIINRLNAEGATVKDPRRGSGRPLPRARRPAGLPLLEARRGGVRRLAPRRRRL